jgi:tetratricopeptide (TPR) repeat protein
VNAFGTVPLQLKPSQGASIGDRTGFWLQSEDVTPSMQMDRWIEAILTSQETAKEEVAFYLLPPPGNASSLRNPNAFHCGGLIGIPQGNVHLHLPTLAIPLVPYMMPSAGQGSLWLTAGTEISPSVPNHWLERVFASPALGNVTEPGNLANKVQAWVWLPGIGLVVLEQRDRITLAQLLEPAPQRTSRSAWESPPDVPRMPDRIAGISVLDTGVDHPPLKDIENQIGFNAQGLGSVNLDPSKESSGSSGSSSIEKGKGWLLKKLESLLRRSNDNEQGMQNQSHAVSNIPSQSAGTTRGSGHPKGISAMLYQKLAAAVQQQRNQQLEKLLQMSKHDPDRALQYAIPLEGSGAFRGLAVPGASLLSRFPNYSSSGMGSGGGLADFWQVDYQLQRQLRESYLEMANREAAAKRYRRAAYIHANLLADFGAAAGVLEQGGFYREAAELYCDKLKRPADQARCLAAAGLVEQAVAVYLSLNDYLNAAKTWEAAGNHDEALLEYRRAVEKLISTKKILEAARIMNSVLGERQLALELLWKQWPNGVDRDNALREYFAMLAADGQHALAGVQVNRMVQMVDTSFALELARITQTIARTFPDPNAQSIAEDACRVAIAGGIPSFAPIDMQAAMEILQQLEPNDRVLSHDAARFLTGWNTGRTQKSIPKRSKTRSTFGPTIARLPPLLLKRGDYVATFVVDNDLFAIRKGDHGLYINRFFQPGLIAKEESVQHDAVDSMLGKWSGNREKLEKTGGVVARSFATESKIQGSSFREISHYKEQKGSVVSIRLDANPIPASKPQEISLQGEHRYRDLVTIRTGTPASLETCETVLALGPSHWAGIQKFENEWIYVTCGSNSENLRRKMLSRWMKPTDDDPTYSYLVGIETENFDSQKCLMNVLGGEHIACIGNSLIYDVLGSSSTRVEKLNGTANALAISAPGTRKRIAVGHTAGLDVFWPTVNSLNHGRICNERPYEHVLWMQGGRMFAISGSTLYRFHVQANSAKESGSIELRDGTILGLLALSPGVCGVAFQDGVIERF